MGTCSIDGPNFGVSGRTQTRARTIDGWKGMTLLTHLQTGSKPPQTISSTHTNLCETEHGQNIRASDKIGFSLSSTSCQPYEDTISENLLGDFAKSENWLYFQPKGGQSQKNMVYTVAVHILQCPELSPFIFSERLADWHF